MSTLWWTADLSGVSTAPLIRVSHYWTGGVGRDRPPWLSTYPLVVDLWPQAVKCDVPMMLDTTPVFSRVSQQWRCGLTQSLFCPFHYFFGLFAGQVAVNRQEKNPALCLWTVLISGELSGHPASRCLDDLQQKVNHFFSLNIKFKLNFICCDATWWSLDQIRSRDRAGTRNPRLKSLNLYRTDGQKQNVTKMMLQSGCQYLRIRDKFFK